MLVLLAEDEVTIVVTLRDALEAAGHQVLHAGDTARALEILEREAPEVVLTDTTESFKEVLLIEYPRKGLYSLCFQTSTQLGEVQSRTGEDVICVFVPTTPNPTSGVMIIVPRADVVVLDMQIEEAVKMVVSLGVVVPQWRGRPAVGAGETKLPAPDNA